MPDSAPLTAKQRNRIRNLAVSTGTLGQSLSSQKSTDCVAAYQESIRYCQRLNDNVSEAIGHYNLGRAYMEISNIRDLDAAEAAYQHSLQLRDIQDALGRARSIKHIGMVYYERFIDVRIRRTESPEILLSHFQAAKSFHLQALKLCPDSAITDIAPMHGSLGNLYRNIGLSESAREHYEKAARYYEQTGSRYDVGMVRYNLSLTYAQLAQEAEDPKSRRELLERVLAYARASLRDYQSYQGHATTDEAEAQELIEHIEQDLAG